MRNDSSVATSAALPGPTLRGFVSLAVLLHLVCVAFVYSANVNPSRLQQRLAGVLAPYTQLLHLDPGGARLQFTDGQEASDDHVVVVTPKREAAGDATDEVVRFPEAAAGLSPRRRRLLTIANDMAAYVDNDSLIAMYARSIGSSVMRTRGWDHVIVRVEHRGAPPLDESTPQQERSVDYVVYEAEVWTDEEGNVLVQKRTTGLQAAPTGLKDSP